MARRALRSSASVADELAKVAGVNPAPATNYLQSGEWEMARRALRSPVSVVHELAKVAGSQNCMEQILNSQGLARRAKYRMY